MKLNYYLKRIINNKLKLGVLLLLIIYPIVDIYTILVEISRGESVRDPNIFSFLASPFYATTQVLLLWYLPLYLLILVADDCIEDHTLGYKQLLISKWGKKSYFTTNIMKGFLFGFGAIFIPLAINFAMTHIAFAGSTYTGMTINTISDELSLRNTLLTNIIYILMVCVIAGIVGIGAVAVSLAFRNRLIVYPTVFIMWYIPSAGMEKSIIYAMQPFTEYLPSHALPGIIVFLVLNLFAIAFAYFKVMKYEKI